MKYLLAIALCVLMLLPLPLAAAEGGAAEIPSDVLEYAESTGMLSIKSFMKRPENRYIGTLFSSAEEIDRLTLGQGCRLYGLSGNPEQWGESLRASGGFVDKWMFSLDDEKGPKALFFVGGDAENGFSFSGARSAKNLSEALAILEALAKKENAAYDPLILDRTTGIIIAQDFNGSEGIITVPGDVFELDGAYQRVRRSSELPKFEEYKEDVLAHLVPEDQYDPASATGGDGWLLKPHFSAARMIPAIVLAAVGAALIGIAAGMVLKRRRKAPSDGAEA